VPHPDSVAGRRLAREAAHRRVVEEAEQNAADERVARLRELDRRRRLRERKARERAEREAAAAEAKKEAAISRRITLLAATTARSTTPGGTALPKYKPRYLLHPSPFKPTRVAGNGPGVYDRHGRFVPSTPLPPGQGASTAGDGGSEAGVDDPEGDDPDGETGGHSRTRALDDDAIALLLRADGVGRTGSGDSGDSGDDDDDDDASNSDLSRDSQGVPRYREERSARGLRRRERRLLADESELDPRAVYAGEQQRPRGGSNGGGGRAPRPHGFGELQLPSGSRYLGLFRHGLRHGHGHQTWPTGTTYDGAWRRGLPHGDGTLTIPARSCVVRGTFVHGVLNGPEATFTYTNHRTGKRTVFEGETAAGVAEGRGTLVIDARGLRGDPPLQNPDDSAAGSSTRAVDALAPSLAGGLTRLDCEWRGGAADGFGRLTRADGVEFAGNFRGGEAAFGRLVFGDGARYAGNLGPGGKLDGVGVLVTASGDRASGSFRDGAMHGLGEYVHVDAGGPVTGDGGEGDGAAADSPDAAAGHFAGAYYGRFADGLRDGPGEYLYADGSRFIGTWRAGARVVGVRIAAGRSKKRQPLRALTAGSGSIHTGASAAAAGAESMASTTSLSSSSSSSSSSLPYFAAASASTTSLVSVATAASARTASGTDDGMVPASEDFVAAAVEEATETAARARDLAVYAADVWRTAEKLGSAVVMTDDEALLAASTRRAADASRLATPPGTPRHRAAREEKAPG
jgi:hypothetical protein